MFLGLRTAIYPSPDPAAAKRWFAELLGKEPYFDSPAYVGFEIGGYELGIVGSDEPGRPEAYWGVADVDAALERLLALGARERTGVTEVGEGIRLATVFEPAGGVLGIIENPGFEVRPEPAAEGGPGR